MYRINCKDCHAVYVGQTKRQLITRIKEHKNNINRQQNLVSVVFLHRMNFQYEFNWDEVEILDIEANYYKRIISESLHIQTNKHSINNSSDTDFLNPLYRPLLNKLSEGW